MALDKDKQVYLAGGLMALMLFIGGMSIHFSGDVERLPLRKLPQAPSPEETITRQLRYGPEYYKAVLQEDGKKYGVPAPDPTTFAKPFPYSVDFSGRQRLTTRKDGGLETKHLKITMEVAKHWAQAPGGGFTTDHLILHIANKTDAYLAYHVVTEPSDARRCQNKTDIPQNAIALTPREEIARTECTVDRTTALYVRRVEVMEIPPLSYHYLCRLRPAILLQDERTSGGHVAGRGRPCDPIAWADIKAGAEAKEVEWADVADFYARHSCDEYTFFRGYKRATTPLPRLPAVKPPR
jgi:hypothetical protein